jgi:molybdate-binding protein
VHLAGIHLSKASRKNDNASAVREKLGSGYSLLHLARWTEGVAVAPGERGESIDRLMRTPLRWVGREPGSGARQCLDELLEGRPAPKRVARDHRGVAEAIRCGWADAGVCLQLVSEEAGLRFLSVRDEAYDVCFRTDFANDPRMRALLDVVRSPAYRQTLGELPGYDVARTGELRRVE